MAYTTNIGFHTGRQQKASVTHGDIIEASKSAMAKNPGLDADLNSRVDHETCQLGQLGPQLLSGSLLNADAAVHIQGGQRGATAAGQAVDGGVCDAPDAVQTQQLQFVA